MKDAVKTDRKAEELVINWMEENKLPEEITGTEWGTSQCECGETQCFIGNIYRIDGTINYVKVNICDICGDDDHMNSDVLEIR